LALFGIMLGPRTAQRVFGDLGLDRPTILFRFSRPVSTPWVIMEGKERGERVSQS